MKIDFFCSGFPFNSIKGAPARFPLILCWYYAKSNKKFVFKRIDNYLVPVAESIKNDKKLATEGVSSHVARDPSLEIVSRNLRGKSEIGYEEKLNLSC